MLISIHAPARGATQITDEVVAVGAFQSTLPRGERPFRKPCRFTTITISIHAPARGATERADDHDLLPQFQSTLPRGERPGHTQFRASDSHFNPRSREGSDVGGCGRCVAGLSISIHAPARGATPREPATGATYLFQSTLPRGERPFFSSSSRLSISFQSTLPRGERQSRSPRSMICAMISIHAPARGATCNRQRLPPTISISIHAPARGATCNDCQSYWRCKISIHAPARGATVFLLVGHNLMVISIHAPARGATWQHSTQSPSDYNFNPRSREGSDFNFI